MAISLGTFRFVLQTPTAKLLNCRVGSLILPSSDGQMGVLRNHIPMLGELGLGVMQVKDITYKKGQPGDDKFFIVDGGFFRISENNVTILAYDVETFEGMEMGQIKEMIAKAKELITGDAYHHQHRKHDVERAMAVLNLARTAGMI